MTVSQNTIQLFLFLQQQVISGIKLRGLPCCIIFYALCLQYIVELTCESSKNVNDSRLEHKIIFFFVFSPQVSFAPSFILKHFF